MMSCSQCFLPSNAHFHVYHTTNGIVNRTTSMSDCYGGGYGTEGGEGGKRILTEEKRKGGKWVRREGGR